MALISIWFVWAFSSCSEKSHNPETQQNKGLLYQVGGCQSIQSAKLTANDSCFSYQFDQQLSVDFCVSGNCCPDSNRFKLSYEIRKDTITVVVVDTAANLCRCNCTYLIRAQFDDLPLDHYLFYCIRADHDNKVVYYQDIYRNRRSLVSSR